ncbi:unnamed protein product [Rotaria sp. Silwood2]|nr:unnamed protein product [Rotaria sp. Silwood2]
MKEIENPDARAKLNSQFEKDDKHVIPAIKILSTPDVDVINENPISQRNSDVHFIIGYGDNKKHEKSRGLLETINSVVAQKQISGENIELSIIPEEKQQSNPYAVKFRISFSSDEDTDDDDDEELTEIVTGCGNRGNVLRKF